jgi:hypothetical protein
MSASCRPCSPPLIWVIASSWCKTLCVVLPMKATTPSSASTANGSISRSPWRVSNRSSTYGSPNKKDQLASYIASRTLVTRFRIAFPSREDLRRCALRGFASPRFALSRPRVATLPIRAHAFAQRIHQVDYIAWFFFRLGASMTWPLALRCISLRSAFSSLEFLGIKPCCFASKNMRRERNHITADTRRRYMRKVLFLIPHLIVVAQRRAEQSLPKRL